VGTKRGTLNIVASFAKTKKNKCTKLVSARGPKKKEHAETSGGRGEKNRKEGGGGGQGGAMVKSKNGDE